MCTQAREVRGETQ